MHILLTDILSCPVCGPPYGLIVLSDTLQERRVIEGALGCPNCEKRFPIRNGVAHIEGEGGRLALAEAASVAPDPGFAVRLAALLGLEQPGGFVLVAGPAASLAGAVADVIDGIEIVADARYSGEGEASCLYLGARLPFFGGKLRGVWLSGDAADGWLEEAARVLHPTGRLVLDPAPADAAARLASVGLRVAMEEAGTVLATRA